MEPRARESLAARRLYSMAAATTRIIGIGGPSGSGKSTLALHLQAALAGGAEVISLDSYYFPLDHLDAAARADCNFDHPGALDWDLFFRQLTALGQGQPIEEPVYRFDLHTRDARTRRVEPTPYVIVEGILALHRPDARALMDCRVYIETRDQECYRRRLDRDTLERGRSGESVERQYRDTVRPMAEQFVWPTRQNADLVVSGERGYDEPVQAVMAWLWRGRGGAPVLNRRPVWAE